MARSSALNESPESVLAELPDWAGATVEELHGGQTNRTWLVEADGRKAILKIDEVPRQAPYNSRRDEQQIQDRAAETGLATPTIRCTATTCMTEYLEGTVWSAQDLQNEENLKLLGQALRRLHRLPLTGRTFDARSAARMYAGRITDADPELLRSSLRVVDRMPAPHNLCFCHNDLVAGNIIATPDIRFLDWEYACDNDPFFDLATIVAHHDLSPERRNILLDAYFDGDGVRWRERLGMYERFYTAILWLWTMARSRAGGQGD